jgi:riboflavin-specific deaminase-like protein
MRRPNVALHFAQSLDGRIAVTGHRTQLSSPEGVALAHRKRAEHDAVLVGSRTVRIDDPRLTVRACPGRNPLRVVLASTLDVRTDAQTLASDAKVLVIGVDGRSTRRNIDALAAAGADVRLVPAGEDSLVSLPHALGVLSDIGVRRLLVEGGSRVLTAFVRSRLVDQVSIEIAARWLGPQGLTAIDVHGQPDHGPSLCLVDTHVVSVAGGFVISGSLAHGEEAEAPRSGRRLAGAIC